MIGEQSAENGGKGIRKPCQQAAGREDASLDVRSDFCLENCLAGGDAHIRAKPSKQDKRYPGGESLSQSEEDVAKEAVKHPAEEGAVDTPFGSAPGTHDERTDCPGDGTSGLDRSKDEAVVASA